MPREKLFTAFITLLLTVPVYLQIAHVNAQDGEPLTGPLTPPITSEVTPTATLTPTLTPTVTVTLTPTSTLTPTVTPSVTVTPTPTPVEEGTLSGTVMLRKIGFGSRTTPGATPAAGVEVVVEPFFGEGDEMTDTTDAQGNYSFELAPGLYKVDVDENNAFYVPPFRVVNIKEDMTKDADFQGLLLR